MEYTSFNEFKVDVRMIVDEDDFTENEGRLEKLPFNVYGYFKQQLLKGNNIQDAFNTSLTKYLFTT